MASVLTLNVVVEVVQGDVSYEYKTIKNKKRMKMF